LSRERLSPALDYTAVARKREPKSEGNDNDNDEERAKGSLPTHEQVEASSKSTTTTTTTTATAAPPLRHIAASVLDVTEETERERGLCPNGADCGSEDPFHFVLFRHTARDEFSVPVSRADALFLSSRSDVLRPLLENEFHSLRQQPAGEGESEGLSAKRALLRRSVSDSGLKREISLPNLSGLVDGRPSGNRGERSGWLHKRTPLLKVPCTQVF
jgi:hypothetical protein